MRIRERLNCRAILELFYNSLLCSLIYNKILSNLLTEYGIHFREQCINAQTRYREMVEIKSRLTVDVLSWLMIRSRWLLYAGVLAITATECMKECAEKMTKHIRIISEFMNDRIY